MKRLLEWLERTLGPPRRRRCVNACGTVRQRTSSKHDRRLRVIGLALSVLAMNAKTAIATERVAHFDTDSEWVGVDNRCSGCISHVRSDFVSELKASNRVVKGFGGSRTTNVKIGTLRWSWEDDQGRTHTFDIKNSYYIPDGKVRLLSPQHWAQSQATTSNKSLRTSCGEHTNGLECVLYWGDGEYKRHIDLGRNDNVATFPLAHGYSQFAAFCCEAGMDDQDRETIAMPSAFISDDESVAHEEVEERPALSWSQYWTSPSTPTEDDGHTTPTVDFNLNGPTTPASEGESHSHEPAPEVIIDEEDRQTHTDMAELLTVHHQYAHAPMAKLQMMAKAGILPKRLSKCRIPVCSACLYAKATRRPWRTKPRTRNANDPEEPSKPGQVISVDQL
ncbi:hypothetical protein MHU86_2339 [Fragilaria crotonensis]|nr:hypothetical protein MHU86_2339 [Fragilaria crotonensis]